MRTGLKDNVAYSFFDPEIGVLKDMIALITPDHVGMFRESYGGILKMVFRLTDCDRSAIHTLLQFYDPGLRCFVFPDYLLGPLMEDYVSILGIQIRDQIPFHVTRAEPDVLGISRALYLSPEMVKEGWKEKGKLPGFHLSFLEANAKEHAAAGNWKTVCALIAVSIYGIVLFPNQKNFVDHNAIRLFMQRNPIPTLIGDVYYSVHNRNEKRRGGLVRCCSQLLFRWFMGYLPSRGAFVQIDPSVKWSFLCPRIEGPSSSVSMDEFLEVKRERDQLLAEKTELEMSVARVQRANQELKAKMEDQDKRLKIMIKEICSTLWIVLLDTYD
ncbi:uncharacterized protein LOC127130310 [Lathyrus oleraceus]|uniref:uncharacterized protein LOC127130310 n=1 Tax=Pisum sativum TaxID=3888 RepID=UPI0021CEBC84|nr:uncharacterized protein LOC127130310 [Pisum sativum]